VAPPAATPLFSFSFFTFLWSYFLFYNHAPLCNQEALPDAVINNKNHDKSQKLCYY
jgi:uncharacterized membrane protein